MDLTVLGPWSDLGREETSEIQDALRVYIGKSCGLEESKPPTTARPYTGLAATSLSNGFKEQRGKSVTFRLFWMMEVRGGRNGNKICYTLNRWQGQGRGSPTLSSRQTCRFSDPIWILFGRQKLTSMSLKKDLEHRDYQADQAPDAVFRHCVQDNVGTSYSLDNDESSAISVLISEVELLFADG